MQFWQLIDWQNKDGAVNVYIYLFNINIRNKVHYGNIYFDENTDWNQLESISLSHCYNAALFPATY